MERHDTLLTVCGRIQNRQILRAALQERFHLLEAANARQALLLLEQNMHCIAAVVLDYSEPGDSLRQLQSGEARAYLSRVPVIIMCRQDAYETINQAFLEGAADVIPLLYDQTAMLHRIENIVDLHLHRQQLAALAEEQAQELRHANDNMVDALSSIIEYRSVESGQHVLRIRQFARILLDELARNCPEYALTEDKIRSISSAAALHDVGKIAIPDEILMKPGKLTEEEMQVMRTHTVTGCRLLQRLHHLGDREYLRYAHNICRYHHERWDGKGYPEGLKGDDIPICAQVVGLADVYDALTTKRVYKEAYPFDTAVNMILKGECGAFSPKLLECFKHVTGEYEALAKAFEDGKLPEDTQLPTGQEEKMPAANDSMEITWAKYQALVHYCNVFLMELDLDRGVFHLVYNPYPEFTGFQRATSFAQLETLLLNELVTAQDRPELEDCLKRKLHSFLEEGLRRVTYRFHFREPDAGEGSLFEVTLLRIRPTDSKRRTLAVLGKKLQEAKITAAPGIAPDRDICIAYDEGFTVFAAGSTMYELTGYEENSLRGRPFLNMVPEDERGQLRDSVADQLSRGREISVSHRLVRKDGSRFWVLHTGRLENGPDGREYLHSSLSDISSCMETVEILERKLSRYEIILAQTENVLFEWDLTTDALSVSDTWKKIFGSEPASTDVHRKLLQGAYFHPDDLPMLFDGISNLQQGSAYEMAEVRVATEKGRYLWCRFRATAIRDGQGTLKKIAGIIINIDAEKQEAQALQERAERDSLTKLLNKNTGRKRAEAYFRQFSDAAQCALLIIDLDDFKGINDRYGHLFGDAVLTKAAREIKRLFRNQDIIARIGGDEFMVLMRGVADRVLVENRCQRLLSVFDGAFQSGQHKISLKVSVGIAMSPEHGSSYYEVFEHADQALYEAKRTGKNRYAFYDPLGIPQRHRTAVSHRIDSDEQPGMANGSIVQAAFRQLYTATDMDAAMNNILQMIGRQMNVSRVYVFENSPDNRFCSNTYEWCNDGIRSEIHNLQNISYEQDIPGYEAYFDEQGVFYCPDIEVLPKAAYDIVAAQGIRSMLQCAIRENGVFRGYVGFDECVSQRLWTKDQIDLLGYFSEMLSVFLLKKQATDKIRQRLSDLNSILDNQNAWIYIIDPESCELKYINARAKELSPEIRTGTPCYQGIMGREKRCEGCPACSIARDKTCTAVLHNDRLGVKMHSEATLIQWEGREACLLTCHSLD